MCGCGICREECAGGAGRPASKLRHLGDRVFDYLIPADLDNRVTKGAVVTVPFGSRTARGGCGPWQRF